MKNIFFLIVALLCAVRVSAQTPDISPDRLPIGGVAVAEALAAAKNIDIWCSAPTGTFFTKTVDLSGITSVDDILPAISAVNVQLTVNDPKVDIDLKAAIHAADGSELFTATNRFKLSKKGYDSNRNPIYATPDYAGSLWFILATRRISVPGAVTAEMYSLDGQHIYQLTVYPGGLVEIPGWMNQGGFSQLVINNSVYYDMITGAKLKAQTMKTGITFSGLEAPPLRNGLYSITAYPQYGSLPSYKVKSVGGHIRYEVATGDYSWIHPVSIWVARLQDLRPGGVGWKQYSYSPDFAGDIALPSGDYILYPEYDTQDVGSNVYGGKG